MNAVKIFSILSSAPETYNFSPLGYLYNSFRYKSQENKIEKLL